MPEMSEVIDQLEALLSGPHLTERLTSIGPFDGAKHSSKIKGDDWEIRITEADRTTKTGWVVEGYMEKDPFGGRRAWVHFAGEIKGSTLRVTKWLGATKEWKKAVEDAGTTSRALATKLFKEGSKRILESLDKKIPMDRAVAKMAAKKAGFKGTVVVAAGKPVSQLDYRRGEEMGLYSSYSGASFHLTKPSKSPKTAAAAAKKEVDSFQKESPMSNMADVAGLVYWADSKMWSGAHTRFVSRT